MIDIDGLSEDELLDLNRRIVTRLRHLREVQAHEAMQAFRIGDRVSFQTGPERITGVISRYNRRTVTVVTDGGLHWKVAPSLLQRVGPGQGTGPVIEGEVMPSSD